ncbi:phosphatase PAP2 family protein [Porphyromonas cangingivalis]|uniref:phosphatase PAP2 family protein n=1 Tax=Porphyromonas cangingivalis TaxID=36874 RepID=UPI000690FAA0|nr:phosphatase PAP2 family protein [Porphyromonas cangingivalis]
MRSVLAIALCFLSVLHLRAQGLGEQMDVTHRKDSLLGTLSRATYVPYVQAEPLSAIIIPAQVTLGMGFMMWEEDRSVRSLRHHYIGGFKTRLDDYTQLVPLAVTWGLLGMGKAGRSQTVWESFVAQASSFVILTAITQGGKYSIGRLRPDASAHNSFPSGHTGTAFACAAILDAEYGQQYPWLAGIGYGVATLTGMSRIANNRHWGTDVLVGASVGLSSVYLGYFLSDWIFGRKRVCLTKPFALGESSPFLLSLDNARTGLFKKVGAFSPDRPMLSLGLSARVPVYKNLGTVVLAKIFRGENREGHEHLNAHALLVGLSYMRPILGGRMWWDIETGAGYLSAGRIGKISTVSADGMEIEDYTRASAIVKIGGGLTLVTHRTFGMRVGAGYLFAPSALPAEGLLGRHNNGYEVGLSLSYLLDIHSHMAKRTK